VQNAFIGILTDNKLLKIANLISYTIDPRILKTLNKAEITDIEQSSKGLQCLISEASDARA
jgi:hypothetical protein